MWIEYKSYEVTATSYEVEKNGHLTRENREHKEKEHKEAGAKTQEEARPEKAKETQTTKTNV